MKKIVLGRAAENDMVYATPEVSAQHAELLWDGHDLWLRDLGSTNGTFINGRRVESLTRVAQHDRVTLGKSAAVDLAAARALLAGSDQVQRITVGRAADNTLVIDDGRVSAHHAVLERKGALWVIRDLQSTNGTYINGERATGERVLERGAVVRFGIHGPAYEFPDAFGITLAAASTNADGASAEADAPGAGHTAVLPVLSRRTDMWRNPQMWSGLVVLIVMCLLFSYTGNPFAYNSYIYLFGFFSCATVLWFVYRMCGKRQPWWYVVAPAVFTAIVTVPVLVIVHTLIGAPASTAHYDGLQRFLHETFITGLTEEFVKILPLLVVLALARMKIGAEGALRIREPLDGILMAASSAIGFVVLETIFLYCNPRDVCTDYQAWKALQLLIPRIFASVGGHVAYSGYFGYFIGLGMQYPARFWRYALLGYGSAALCHGLWNTLGVYGVPWMIGTSCIAYLLFIAAILRARATSHSALRHTVYR